MNEILNLAEAAAAARVAVEALVQAIQTGDLPARVPRVRRLASEVYPNHGWILRGYLPLETIEADDYDRATIRRADLQAWCDRQGIPLQHPPKPPRPRESDRPEEHRRWRECAADVQAERKAKGLRPLKKEPLADEVIARLGLSAANRTVRGRL